MLTLKEGIKDMWYKLPPEIKYRAYTLNKSRPMEKVLAELEENKVNLHKLNALEVFGKNGEWHTMDYAYKVNSLEIWEMDENCRKTLNRNFPFAIVKIVDSYEEMERCENKFSLIVIDNPISTYGSYCEHFLFFPKIFNLCDDDAIIILNVIPKIDEEVKREYPYLFNDIQLEKRSEFYKTDFPNELTFKEMDLTYKNMALKEHFKTEWSFFQKRNFVYYYVFKIKKFFYA